MSDTTVDRTQPPAHLSMDLSAAGRGLARFREATADIAEVILRGAADEFRVQTSTVHLGGAVLMDSIVTPMAYDRSALHVARSGIDHFQVAMYTHGSADYSAGRRSVALRPGDVFIVDMAQPNCTRNIPAADGTNPRVLTVVLPRAALAPLLAAPDAVQASVLSRDSAAGRLVGGHLLALADQGPSLDGAAAHHGVRQLLHVVAQSVGPAARTNGAGAAAARQLLLSAIKRHIERHLMSPQLSTDALCLHFRLSRATLYRLFEPEGGLRDYINQRRLMRAFVWLAGPQGSDLRIIDVALASRFAGDATFARAFRRLFGVTPGEVRALAATRLGGDRDASGSPVAAELQARTWVRNLGAAIK